MECYGCSSVLWCISVFGVQELYDFLPQLHIAQLIELYELGMV